MSTDLSNREQQVYDYLKEVFKVEFPNADLRDDGEFMETFGLPFVKLSEPLLTYIDRLKLQQSLDNANNMTFEEMDEVAFANYMSRNMGERATGVVTAIIEDFPASGTLVIPAGIEVTSKNGFVFRSSETMTLNEVSLSAFYDASTFSYHIPIQMIAAAPGTAYNIEAGDIVSLNRGMIPNLVDIINEGPFTGGTNSENNAQLANRILESRFSHNLGTTRGYKRYLSSFDGVKDTLLAGYKHPLMKRDVIGTVEAKGIKFHENVRDLHWGTKIDAYVRGENPEEVVEYLEVFKDGDDLFVNLKSVPVLDIVDVRLFSLTGEFDDPNIEQTTLYVTNYAVIKEEDFETEGTIYEKAKMLISDERVEEGRYLRVAYRYNELVPRIHNALYEGDERSATADVKIKEANKKFVFGAVVASMKSVIGMKESDRSLIRQRLKVWIEQLQMGAELQFSDLQEPLYAIDDPDGEGIVEYVHLPYQFLVLENNNRYIFYCLSEKQRGIVKSLKNVFPRLHQVIDKYKDSVTTYDFFDLLHSFTQETGFDENIRSLQYRTGRVGAVASVFPQLRDMTLASKATKRLSPAVKSVEENEYFALGESYIYESKEYEESDWEQMILLAWNIANQQSEEEDVKVVYHLAVYILTVMFIATTPEAVDDPSLVQRYVRKLVERTPVEFEFDL